MVAWEMEARRDRKAMLAALESGGRDALQKKLLAVLSRVTEQAGGVQMARSLPATNVEAWGGSLSLRFCRCLNRRWNCCPVRRRWMGRRRVRPGLKCKTTDRSARSAMWSWGGWRGTAGANLPPAARCRRS